MVSLLKWCSDIFWTDSLWLGSGRKWADVTNGPDKKILYPDVKDYLYQIPLTILFILVRYTVEKYLFVPLGRIIGVKDKKQKSIQDVPLLEAAYRKSPQAKDTKALAKQLDMSERQVERWWRVRHYNDRPSNMTKFKEHVWKAAYYGSNGIFGLYIMWDKDYFWDLDKCFIGYPHQGVTNDVWWFYTINTAYTMSSIITVFFDVRRKDFKEMVVHHLLVAILLMFSWISSFYRIGVVLLPLQDISESVLEVAKAFKVASYDQSSKVTFYFFAVIWFYVRMYIYPFQIMYSTCIRVVTLMDPIFIGVVMDVMLFALLILQVYWSTLILRVIYNYVVHKIERDIRSSSSEMDSQFSDSCTKNGVNGSTEGIGGIASNGNGIEGRVGNRNDIYARVKDANGRDKDTNGINGSGIITSDITNGYNGRNMSRNGVNENGTKRL